MSESFSARTPTLPPATHTNSYALGEREVILVEPATPYDDEQRAWLAWARGIEAQGRKVVGLFVTHHHEDHVGGLEVLARELGVPVLMHAETSERVARLAGEATVRHLGEGDELTLAGPEGTRLRVLHTPGHAPGHLCLFDAARGTLVVGDMVASVGTILVAPGDGDMIRYLAELARLETLGAKVALPAHGAPIPEPSKLFAHYVSHRLAREAKVLAAVSAAGDGAGADALVPVAYADTAPAAWPWARLSLEAHLEKLVREGRVTKSDGTTGALYRAARPAS